MNQSTLCHRFNADQSTFIHTYMTYSKMKTFTCVIASISLYNPITAFTVSPSIVSCSDAPNHLSCLYSSPQDGDQNQSIIIEGLSSLGSEAGYLEAARKRNEEAKAKLREQVRLEEEEAERKRQEKLQRGAGESNYGPGDLSNFKGFENDGFEASAGNDQEGGWSKEAIRAEEDAIEEKQEEPKLFLFGDDEGLSTDSGGLLL
jgi:hypothetical protein